MAPVLAAIIGALSGALVPLLGNVGTRTSLLRHLQHEADVIAAMPAGSSRRAELEAASDIYAGRYRRHAETPHVRRNVWLAAITSAALVGVATWRGFTTDHVSEASMSVAGITLGGVGFLYALHKLTRL